MFLEPSTYWVLSTLVGITYRAITPLMVAMVLTNPLPCDTSRTQLERLFSKSLKWAQKTEKTSSYCWLNNPSHCVDWIRDVILESPLKSEPSGSSFPTGHQHEKFSVHLNFTESGGNFKWDCVVVKLRRATGTSSRLNNILIKSSSAF